MERINTNPNGLASMQGDKQNDGANRTHDEDAHDEEGKQHSKVSFLNCPSVVLLLIKLSGCILPNSEASSWFSSALWLLRYHLLLLPETPCPQGGRYLGGRSNSPKLRLQAVNQSIGLGLIVEGGCDCPIYDPGWQAVQLPDCCPMKMAEEIVLTREDHGGV